MRILEFFMETVTLFKRCAKSRTMLFAATLAALGVVELQFQLIAPLIPDAWQGAVLLAIAVAVAILRVVTTGPIGEGRDNDDS